MRKHALAIACFVAVVATLRGGVTMAEEIVIDASQIVGTMAANGNGTFGAGNGMGYWSADNGGLLSGGTNLRYDAIEFNISSVTEPITGAVLKFYADSYWRNTSAFSMTASQITPSGITGLTYNSSAYKTKTPLESLGSFSTNGAAGVVSTWYTTASASVADLAKLETVRAGNGVFDVLFIPTEYVDGHARELGSTSGFMPQLILTTGSVPEPSTLTLLVVGLVGLLCYAWRKRK